MTRVSLFILLLSGVTLLPSYCRQTQEEGATKADSRTVLGCKGDNLTLHKPDIGVTVLFTSVFRGENSLANSFIAASGEFHDRLAVEMDGRVILSNLIPDDFGKYRVEVQLSKSRQIQHSLRLVISEPPETKYGTLLVTNIPTSGNNSVRLTCGNFTSLGFPPVSVIWKDPRGDMLPNDGFEDQAFYLDLPLSSAVSGDYCCQLDCRAPDYCCLDPQSPLRQCAPVHVQTDTVEEVKKVDCPSLDSFSRLQQQVLDLVMAQRELQESESQSGVATIAQLVQRQAKCDQLDVYMTRVEDLEDKLKIGLDAAMNKALISDERWRQG
ncbi:uncharacterized protein LOC112561619 [Pomacea canaliculata]|uniref:uncharacterized protein LOC112561619 n=1 Tax=Pomacea canaliculata TaxID=400727 RepID=UPI000D725CB1|nr:uncharacterized protein LOC112561619 [Pomacea canaliculata]